MKIHVRENFRVEVAVPDHNYISAGTNRKREEELIDTRCREIKDRIVQHIDDCRGWNALEVQVVCDHRDVCSFCGFDWEEDGDGLPACCSKAQLEYEANRA